MEKSEEAALLEMNKEVYVAAMKGNVKFIEETTQSDEFYLLRKTQQNNNIIHLAIQSERLEFIEAVLRRFPNNIELICEQNSQKNTPLHIAAELGNLDIGKLIYGHLEKMKIDEKKPWPWRLKNLKGNTAVHHAIINANVDIAEWFLEKDPGFAAIVNHSNESPLHLAIKHFSDNVENESIKGIIEDGEAPSTIYYGCKECNKSRRIISNLVLIAGYVTCWHDINGLTPLHKAALLHIPNNVEITRFIIEQWPQSAEECDNSGKSILHLLINKVPTYEECKNLLNLDEIFKLRNYQDHQGNTPLHIATSKMDTNMARVLIEFKTNLNITNMEGMSATSIIQEQSMIEMLQKGKMTKEDCEAADRADVEFLKERLKMLQLELLRSRDSNGRNILHKLFNCKTTPSNLFEDFIKQILSLNPTLLHQTDLNGDTPIHVLVRESNHLYNRVRDVLYICAQFIAEMEKEASNKGIPYHPPWGVQNADGNTPLLAAVSIMTGLRDQGLVVLDLILHHSRAICKPTNNNGENAFHLVEDKNSLFFLIEKGEGQLWGISQRDNNDLTPIMRALKRGRMHHAVELLRGELLGGAGVYGKKDEVEHLSIAIKNKQFEFINHFFDKYEHFHILNYSGDKVAAIPFFFNHLDRKDVTPADLLAEIETVPPYVAAKLRRYPELRGIRSTWDIPRSQLQNYMSSMNVIAALLTTITFTAAFTVPGGLDQEKGYPLLMASEAFQVFMIADVVAMCLSMMVLFCLLWIVATNKRQAVVIQDFAISLLLASFVATLVTFMMGVYATIFPLKSRIAIATLVLCSILMLLVHRFILTKMFIPLMTAIRHPIYGIKETIIIIKKFIKFLKNLFASCVLIILMLIN